MNSYVINEPVHLSVTFASGGTAADPTGVTGKVRTPSGTITTYASGDGNLIRDGVGLYHLDITPTVAGVWSYRFIGTGVLVAASEAEFYVQPSDFGVNG